MLGDCFGSCRKFDGRASLTDLRRRDGCDDGGPGKKGQEFN